MSVIFDIFYLLYSVSCCSVLFFIVRRPPIATRTDTLFPDTTLFRSGVGLDQARAGAVSRDGDVRAVRIGSRCLDAAFAQPRCAADRVAQAGAVLADADRKSTRLNSSH